jgi:hypothetical protein
MTQHEVSVAMHDDEVPPVKVLRRQRPRTLARVRVPHLSLSALLRIGSIRLNVSSRTCSPTREWHFVVPHHRSPEPLVLRAWIDGRRTDRSRTRGHGGFKKAVRSNYLMFPEQPAI